MPASRCSCGSALPDGAEYCPGCGRPLTPEALARDRAEYARPVTAAETAPVRRTVGFGNPDALRACYWPGVLAALLFNLPVVNLLFLAWQPGMGFLAVAGYRKRTRTRPTVAEGARLGWMTGVVAFTLWLALLTAASLIPGSGGLAAIFEKIQADFEASGQAEVARQVGEMAQDPAALAAVMGLTLLVWFAVMTGLAAAGGALAARSTAKDGAAP